MIGRKTMGLNNNIRLVGFCADAPIFTATASGKERAHVWVYTEEFFLNEGSGKYQPRKDRHYCVFWGRNAVRANEQLMKGTQIHLSGIQTHYEVENNGKKARLPQIWVEQFKQATKALMTKQLYDQIFSDHQSPYQLSIDLREKDFDLDVYINTFDLDSLLKSKNEMKFKIEFYFPPEDINTDNKQSNKNKINKKLVFSMVLEDEKNFSVIISKNRYTQQYQIKNLPRLHFLNGKAIDLLHTIVVCEILTDERDSEGRVIEEKQHQCEFEFLACVLNKV